MKFNVNISLKNYQHKPSKEEIKKIRFKSIQVDVDEMVELVKQGFVYTSMMKDNWRRKENFQCSNTLTYDIDKCDVQMEDYISNLQLKPTFAYTSSRNGTEGYGFGYRLVYVMRECICTLEEYEMLSRGLAQQLQLTYVDDKSYDGVQMWFGSAGCSVYKTYNILSKNSIEKWNVKNGTQQTLTVAAPDVLNIQKCNSNYNVIPPPHYGLTCTFQKDYETLPFADIINKYRGVYENVQRTPIHLDEDEPIVKYPSDFYEIRRPWKKINGDTLKIKDGERRRKKLFLNGIIRRKIKPDITFENLLFNLVYEFYYYYINNGNKITKYDILKIAESVMNEDVDKYDIGKPRYSSFVNPLYCKKYGLTPKQVIGKLKNKKQYIGEFYDPSLKDKENIEVMKEYGLEVSLRTLKNWKKENNIKKYNKNLDF